jgi:hypothetical protein
MMTMMRVSPNHSDNSAAPEWITSQGGEPARRGWDSLQSVVDASQQMPYRALYAFQGHSAAQQLSFDAGALLWSGKHAAETSGEWMWCTSRDPVTRRQCEAGWCPKAYLSPAQEINGSPDSTWPLPQSMWDDRETTPGFEGPIMGGDFIRSSDVHKEENDPTKQRRVAKEEEGLQVVDASAAVARTVVAVPSQRGQPVAVQTAVAPFRKTGRTVVHGAGALGQGLIHLVVPAKEEAVDNNQNPTWTKPSIQTEEGLSKSSKRSRRVWPPRRSK